MMNYKKILAIFLAILLTGLTLSLASARIEVYDYDGYNLRQKINYTRFDAENFTGTRMNLTENVTASWFSGKINWSDIQHKFIETVDNIYIYMSGTTATLNETKLNNTIDSRATIFNDSIKSYIDSQDTSFNDTIGAYVLAKNNTLGDYVIAKNNSLGSYIVTKNNSMGTYVRAQDVIYNTTMGTYVIAKNATMGTYARAQDLIQAKNDSLATWASGKFIAQSDEGNLDVNSSTWWAGLTAWTSGWFTEVSNSLGFNATKLNETIGIYNDSMKAYSDAKDVSYNSTMGSYVIAKNNTMGAYVIAKNASMGSYVNAQDLSYNSTIGTYILAKNSSMGNYVIAKNNTMGSYVIAKNNTLGVYVLAKNNSMGTYVRAQDVIYNTTMGTYVIAKNATMGTYARAQDLIVAVNTTQADWADNKFVVNSGGDSLNGQYDFNGGWTSNGLSIIDGNIYAQTGYFYNLTGLDVNTLKINGSILPQVGYDNQFNIGSSSLRWKDLYLGGEVFSNGTGNNYFLGNVGIGTSSPATDLEIVNNTRISGAVLRITNSAESSSWVAGDEMGSIEFSQTDASVPNKLRGKIVSIAESGGNAVADVGLAFHTTTDLGVTLPERMRINHAGNVGIGTASPQKLLHLNGAGATIRLQSDGSSDTSMQFYDGATQKGQILWDESDGVMKFVAGTTSNVNHLIIDSTGNVGIGTDSPDSKLDVQGVDNTNIFQVKRTGGDVVARIRADSDGDGLLVLENSSSDNKVFLYSNGDSYFNGGNVGIGTTTPGNTLNVLGDFNVTGNTYFGSDLNLDNNTLQDVYCVNFSNGDTMCSGGSISINIDGNERLLLGENYSQFTLDVRNVDNINDWSRFSERNENNGTHAIAGFTAQNIDGDEIRMGITSRGFSVGNANLIGGQSGLFSNSSSGIMGFSLGYNIGGFNWRTNPFNDGSHENTTKILMDLDSNGNLNVTGNITANNFYGEIYGVNIGEVIIASSGVYYNITNTTSGLNNGFTFNSSGQGELTTEKAGVYSVTSQMSFSDGANTLFHITLGINGVGQNKCEGGRKIGTGGDEGSASYTCFINLNIGDKINAMIVNEDNTNNPTINRVQLNLVRIGN